MNVSSWRSDSSSCADKMYGIVLYNAVNKWADWLKVVVSYLPSVEQPTSWFLHVQQHHTSRQCLHVQPVIAPIPALGEMAEGRKSALLPAESAATGDLY